MAVLDHFYGERYPSQLEELLSLGDQCASFLPALSDDPHSVFCPPVSSCMKCKDRLSSYSKVVEVDFFKLTGSLKAAKISLKCSRCQIFYGYSKYGNPQSGWAFYKEPRPAVEASDVCFVERALLSWQISLGLA